MSIVTKNCNLLVYFNGDANTLSYKIYDYMIYIDIINNLFSKIIKYVDGDLKLILDIIYIEKIIKKILGRDGVFTKYISTDGLV